MFIHFIFDFLYSLYPLKYFPKFIESQSITNVIVAVRVAVRVEVRVEVVVAKENIITMIISIEVIVMRETIEIEMRQREN